MENDHVPDPGVRVHPVDQDALIDGQRRQHRPGWDSVRLDQKRLDQQRETDRDGNGEHQLHQRPRTALQ
jgi:hypothetical protein